MRRGVAAGAAVLVVLAALTACTPSRERVALDSGLLAALAEQCAETSRLPADANLQLDAAGWRVTSPGYTVQSSGRGAVVYGSTVPTDPDGVAGFARCMQSVAVDFSLARADGSTQRLALYGWYRTALIPCLAARGVRVPPLPAPAVFVDRPYGESDPYSRVHVSSVAAALRLQAACPPAPPKVLLEARAAYGADS